MNKSYFWNKYPKQENLMLIQFYFQKTDLMSKFIEIEYDNPKLAQKQAQQVD